MQKPKPPRFTPLNWPNYWSAPAWMLSATVCCIPNGRTRHNTKPGKHPHL